MLLPKSYSSVSDCQKCNFQKKDIPPTDDAYDEGWWIFDHGDRWIPGLPGTGQYHHCQPGSKFNPARGRFEHFQTDHRPTCALEFSIAYQCTNVIWYYHLKLCINHQPENRRIRHSKKVCHHWRRRKETFLKHNIHCNRGSKVIFGSERGEEGLISGEENPSKSQPSLPLPWLDLVVSLERDWYPLVSLEKPPHGILPNPFIPS